MKRKINTIPAGKVLICYLLISNILSLFCGILTLGHNESIIFIALTVFISTAIFYLFRKLAWNVVVLTETYVSHRDNVIDWQDAYISIYCEGIRCFAYFSNKPLSKAEIEKNKFCIFLTPKRLEFLLTLCKNEIGFSNKVSRGLRNDDYVRIIKQFNKNINSR